MMWGADSLEGCRMFCWLLICCRLCCRVWTVQEMCFFGLANSQWEDMCMPESWSLAYVLYRGLCECVLVRMERPVG